MDLRTGMRFCVYIFQLLIRQLRINLRGGNRGMSHHPAYRLYRNAERKGDVGTEIMPAGME